MWCAVLFTRPEKVCALSVAMPVRGEKACVGVFMCESWAQPIPSGLVDAQYVALGASWNSGLVFWSVVLTWVLVMLCSGFESEEMYERCTLRHPPSQVVVGVRVRPPLRFPGVVG